MNERAHIYPPAEQNPSFSAIEKEILERWRRDRIFEASVANRPRVVNGKSNEFVFYDGPPFANGLPHYGHLVTGFVKDLVPRYQTMRGRHVERRFGWDCHGLPAELEVEKETGVSGRNAILEWGIANFNAACRTSVQRFTKEWEWYVTREARWVSFENDYKTMDLSYMESVMWAFKTLFDKGLIYEGYRVVPYSWAVQTPLSNFETRLDNSYRERDDPALTVAFTLKPATRGYSGYRGAGKLLAWTTTPWTLPSNMALAVHPKLDYAVMEKDGERLILAQATLERYERELKDYKQVETVQGADLTSRIYEPLFPYFKTYESQAFRVRPADFVGVEDGTGVVHIAPGFGEEDMELARADGIPIVVPVDVAGRFTSEVRDYEGLNVIHEANPKIIKDLKAKGAMPKGVVLRHEQYRHNYPHCWRTDEPLIYKAVNSWYLKVTAFRERMVELNQGIDWVPSHIRDGLFGNWLANARDWNISRDRFWGAPIPVWVSDDPTYPRVDVYGSLDEIERDFGIRPLDLHRPMIDELTRPNPDDPTGKSTMRRVPEVLDCWFESGSMPFAQLHYPFENKERFDANFPGDFIVEYVAQTRGWFYTLMVLSTALFDRAPFKNCICHGVVLGDDHQKMSKRLKNYPDPTEVFENFGADALRWYMLSSPVMSGGDIAVSRADIGKAMRQAILPIWNAYYFFTLYANIDGVKAKARTDQKGVLDRYILAKTREMIAAVQDRLDHYDLPGAYAAVPPFIEALNNWYIRRSRQRFWAEGISGDKQDAFDTLFTALSLTCRAMAPLLPFITERIFVALTGEPSVHLADWPDVDALPEEAKLVRQMDLAREVSSATLALREARRLRVRLPLRNLTVAHPEATILAPFKDIIAEEVNVKEVALSDEPSAHGTRELKVNPRIGAKIGAKIKEVLPAAKEGRWVEREDGRIEVAGIVLDKSDFEMRLMTRDGVAAEPIARGQGLVVLDTTVDPLLQEEGRARDFVRLVQNARKDAGLAVTDRIALTAKLDGALGDAVKHHADYVMGETLSVGLDLTSEPHGRRVEDEIDGMKLVFALEKAG
ncbi:MAG: isoleucine--tRNA ligase [Hyphomicrobiales bacterium]|nr:isoleucine--tRNA ligase [Hyphomicrobiales bacterium]